MLFEERTLAGVPLLIARPGLRGVIWFHGFGVDKETHKPELERIASAGFTAIGVDAVGHGARRLPDLAERQAAPREEAKKTAMELAAATADEVPALIDQLIADNIVDANAIAVAGVSMGGYTVYRAMCDPRVKAAVSLLGSPDLLTESWRTGNPACPGSSRDRQDRQDCLPSTAILSVTGECDVNVPPDGARRFHETLSGTHKYVEIAGAEHLMNEAQWNQAMHEMIGWFTRHLPAALRDPAPP